MRLGRWILVLAMLSGCGGDDPAGSPPLINDTTNGGTGGSNASGGTMLAKATGGTSAADDDAGVQLPKASSVKEAISQATNGQTPTDCGCIGYDDSCPPDQVGNITKCFNDGYATCSPVTLERIQRAMDQSPIVTTYVTQEFEGACRVVVLANWSKDTSANCALYRLLCESIAFTGSGAGTKVDGTMCSPAEVLKEGC